MKKSIVLAALAGIILFPGCFSKNGGTEASASAASEVKAAAAQKTSGHRVTIHMAGDSTCANYDPGSSRLVGWGQVLSEYCKSDVRVNNRAVSGRSSRSYINEKRWDALMGQVKPGDYVIVQFGHNDSKKGVRYADPKIAYPANFKKFIADIRAKKANPVIATSISRCTFKDGKIRHQAALDKYRDAAIAVAKAGNVPVIDLNRITEKNFNAMGEKKAFSYFRGTYFPGQESGVRKAAANNNPPAASGTVSKEKPRTDRTHLLRKGALLVAEWFVADCKAQKLPIADCFK